MASDPKVLLVWGQYPRWMPPVQFSSRQVTLAARLKVAPGFKDQGSLNFNYFSSFEPHGWLEGGGFDLGEYCDRLGLRRDFDFIVVLADQDMGIFPSNVKSFGCPAILLMGDTHHFARPISTLIDYVLREGFCAVASQFTAHHLHWFNKAGVARVGWAPGLMTTNVAQAPARVRKDATVFVGHTWKYHLYRYELLQLVKAARFPIEILTATREEAAERYANTLISFNCSLNGDVNIRNYEVLASGGFLLTDLLHEASGFATLFRPGEACDCYAGGEDLLSKIDFYRRNPESAIAIALRGQKLFREQLNAERALQRFRKYFFEGDDGALLLPPDPRLDEALDPNWRDRLTVYEDVQELHRRNPSIEVRVDSTASWFVASDLGDLSRVRVVTASSDKEAGDYAVTA
ncbi:MAG: glycosyltransferase family 1 protein [Alphaproteobacteria bacterium]|nr:glycosyltransferase family 1 protein [Alphaproteobacteria bacterium]